VALFGRCPRVAGFDPRMHMSSRSDSNSYAVADGNSYDRGYPGSCADSHHRADAHAQDLHSKSYPHTHAYPNADSDPGSYSNSCSCTCSDAHAQDLHSKSYPHTHAHPNADSDPDSCSNSCSCTCSDAHTDTSAYASTHSYDNTTQPGCRRSHCIRLWPGWQPANLHDERRWHGPNPPDQQSRR
jgi:hypothetical protein